VAWLLLVLLALFPIVSSILDIVSDRAVGLPSDHSATFHALAGVAWPAAVAATPGVAHYVTLLEYGYAIHELVFALLFLVIVVIPFRRREVWAWWACWIVLIADVAYTLTFGRHDGQILRQSLIPDIALPVLLLAQAPAFFGRRPA